MVDRASEVCVCEGERERFIVFYPSVCQSAVLLIFDFWSLGGVRG